MDDIRIPCIVWLQGDPPPDLSGISDPIRIPFTLRDLPDEPSDPPTEPYREAPRSVSKAQPGLPLVFDDPPASASPPVEQRRTAASNLPRPESEWPGNADASAGRPGCTWYLSQTCESLGSDIKHQPSTNRHSDDRAPDGVRYGYLRSAQIAPDGDEDNALNPAYPLE